MFSLIKTKCLPVLLYRTEVSPTNSAINHSLQFTLNKVFLKLFGSVSKECYIEIGYYFGIGTIEEIVRKRCDKFLNIVMMPQTIASVSCYIVKVNCQYSFLADRCNATFGYCHSMSSVCRRLSSVVCL